MLGLPPSTVMRKPIPKQVIIERSGLSKDDRKRFDIDVHTVFIVGDVSDKTVNIGPGKDVGRIAILEIRLNTDNYARNTIMALHKAINQRMVLVLRLDEYYRLAILEDRLFESEWQDSEPELPLEGIDLDHAWERMVRHIGGIDSKDGMSLSDQIVLNQKCKDLEDKIAKLRSKMFKEKQHRVKRELYAEIKVLERDLSNLKGPRSLDSTPFDADGIHYGE